MGGELDFEDLWRIAGPVVGFVAGVVTMITKAWITDWQARSKLKADLRIALAELAPSLATYSTELKKFASQVEVFAHDPDWHPDSPSLRDTTRAMSDIDARQPLLNLLQDHHALAVRELFRRVTDLQELFGRLLKELPEPHMAYEGESYEANELAELAEKLRGELTTKRMVKGWLGSSS